MKAAAPRRQVQSLHPELPARQPLLQLLRPWSLTVAKGLAVRAGVSGPSAHGCCPRLSTCNEMNPNAGDACEDFFLVRYLELGRPTFNLGHTFNGGLCEGHGGGTLPLGLLVLALAARSVSSLACEPVSSGL